VRKEKGRNYEPPPRSGGRSQTKNLSQMIILKPVT